MTTATVAPPNGNALALLVALFAVTTFITAAVWYIHERRWERHDDELLDHARQLAGLDYRLGALLEHLGLEIPEPEEDDSPDAEQLAYQFKGNVAADPDCDTDEIPVCPPTVPDGMPLAVHTALIEAEPEMVTRTVNIGGTLQTFRIRANREP